MEQWKPVKGFESIYEVSSYGNVRKYGASRKYLSKEVDKRGFTRVRLNGEKYAVHRMVARAFIPNPEKKGIVNAKDGDKSNIHADNLEWMTVDELVRLPQEPTGSGTGRYFKNSFMDKRRTVECFTLAMVHKGTFPSLQDAAKFVNSNAASIHHALSGRVKTHKNLIWRYADADIKVEASMQ